MPYLIDGYNLLFALLGVPPSRRLRKGLERARNRLLTLLAEHAEEPSAVTVVFDAAAAPQPSRQEQTVQGLHVLYSAHGEQADDLIEDFIRREPAPRRLTVVSNDHRLQKAGRRRHCTVLGCAAYLDQLEKRRPRRAGSVSDGNKAVADAPSSSPAETQHWLAEFADLADDPALKELFDPLGFGESPPS